MVNMDEFRKNLENSFEELGVSYDNDVIEKCLEICNKYDVTDAEDFVDTWMAYTMSHLKGENPTVNNLVKFEREEFGKKPRELQKVPEVQSKSLTIYKAEQEIEIGEASRIMMAYNETTPRRNYSTPGRTPDSSGIKRTHDHVSSPQAVFSPASFSPSITTPSSKYVTRTNSGDVVVKFNDSETNSNRPWKTRENYLAKVETLSRKKIERYMSYDLVDCLEYANNAIERLGKLICAKHSFEDVMPVHYKHPSTFVTVGRIACDSDGRLNAKSVLLEGSTKSSGGSSVYLDLSALQKYSLFPGQIVAVEGHVSGDKLIAKEIYSDILPEPAKPYELPRGALNIMIAAGPYTQSDSMTYQPLLDLIEVAVNNEPHVLILTGPFIDSNHPVVLENTMAETYEEFFGKLVDKIMKPLENKKTQVVIVSSSRDCNADCVYPTPQLTLKTRSYPKLHLLPDPSVFTAEDVVIGVTSTDILLNLSKEEINCPHGAGRLPRIVSHVFEQHSFYPLYPATEVPLDPTLMNSARLDIVPHLLILPSDLRYFIKEISGSVVINPERLAKGVIGGTYARVIVNKNEVVANIVRI